MGGEQHQSIAGHNKIENIANLLVDGVQGNQEFMSHYNEE